MFYGIYSVLFFLCIYVLWKRQKMEKRILHLTLMIALYSLTTAHMVLVYLLAFQVDSGELELGYGNALTLGAAGELEVGYASFTTSFRFAISLFETFGPAIALGVAIKVPFFVSNLLADSVVIYRCYLVWGMRKRIVMFPVFAYICTIASFPLQFSPDIDFAQAGLYAFLAATFLTNLVAVGLTAGRIWWITEKAQALLSEQTKKRYNTATAVILESGIIYPLLLLVVVIIAFAFGGSLGNSVFIGLIYQVVGIAPTLIIVRVGLGVTHDNVETSVNAFRATENGHVSTMGQWTSGRVMDVRPVSSVTVRATT
ncbi:hypothetical protein C8J56DRAFT_1166417 [Mycena floridula]|nr:hypothetical protein C8J56DRAFT_1166417 [Mycena floridula]